MKKTLLTLLACTMLAVSVAGCSSPDSAVHDAANPLETSETVPKAAETTAESVSETIGESTTAISSEAVSHDTSDSWAPAPTKEPLRVGSLKGPTSMGLVSLMDRSAKGEAEGNYEFTMVTAADELTAKMVSGDLDIALVPANMAGILYNKTNHQVNVIDINTLGVLYVVSTDTSIQSIADLKGKTIYLTGKGTSPDFVLQYLLSANGLTTSDVTLEYKSEPAEVAALLKSQPDAIGLLPQPFVTVAMAQNESLQMVLDLTAEWEALEGAEGSLVTGVTICRSDLLADPETASGIRLFMEEHQASADFAREHTEETAQLVADAGIIEKAPIAQKALPYCSITYQDGETMKAMLSGYLNVLFDLNPASVGGSLPEDDFYYIP